MIKENILAVLLAPLAITSCADEFTPYSDVEGFRVLALSSDSPDVLPGENATISALVTEEATYSWSWCPFVGAESEGYPCAISHEEMQEIANQLSDSSIVIPSFDLGTETTAVLPHTVPPEFYQRVCEVLIQSNVPDGFDAPSCTDSFTAQILLTATSGSTSIRSISSMNLLLSPNITPNRNPIFMNVLAKNPSGAEFELLPSMPTQLVRGEYYELALGVDEVSSETYMEMRSGDEMPQQYRENLTIAWFHEGGAIDSEITSYISGSELSSFQGLRTNAWETPSENDHPGDAATLHFVLRDGRGGVTWMSREIELVTL